MKNKKTIMAFSAIFILLFHLWINITNTQTERIVRQLCIIGVDLFFFVSAYSLATRKIEYATFIKNRFYKIYSKFFIFTIIYGIYNHIALTKYIKILLGIDFIVKGGGSFLWFIPSILLLYILLPIYKNLDERYSRMIPCITILMYLVIAITVSVFTSYTAFFIWFNRIPIILLGYYISKYKVIEHIERQYTGYTLCLCIVGGILSYSMYSYRCPFLYDINYICNIPLELGCILLLDKIKANTPISILGSITLELYALQMIFGFTIANVLYKLIQIKIISNGITIVVCIVFAYACHQLFVQLENTKKRDV